NKNQFTWWIRKILSIRKKYERLIVDNNPMSFVMLHDENEHVLAFARVSDQPRKRVAIVTNMNYHAPEMTHVRLDSSRASIHDLLSDREVELKDSYLHTKLQPGQCLVFEY
ncbi:MAG TPA: hypothetical protein VNL69_07790, partial [Bacteroidota bacterium]|nr:hypothetical protein [Bacteroidota bacterium]